MVTIAIPIYNAERYLRDAIQSVINQTYRDWTLYLINDGSSDNSLAIMHEYANRDCRIKIINDGENKGLVARLNQSIALAETKYYARMDADDIMYVTRIEEQVRFLEEHPDVDVLGTSIMTIDDENKIVGSGFCEGQVNGFIHPTVMGHTTWFKSNPYSMWAVRAEDTELWMRTAAESKFWALGKPLLFYREFGVPTLSKTLQSQRTLLRIFSRYKEYKRSIGWFFKNSLITIAKMGVYTFFAAIGHTDYIVKRRQRKPIPIAKRLSLMNLKEAISE